MLSISSSVEGAAGRWAHHCIASARASSRPAFFAPLRARARARSRGAGHTANRCAHRVEPRLGLMPPPAAPAWGAPPGWDAPNALAPFPGDVRRYVCHHLELRSNRSSIAPAGRACQPCPDPLFIVVRHLASKRGALRPSVVRLWVRAALPRPIRSWCSDAAVHHRCPERTSAKPRLRLQCNRDCARRVGTQ